MRQGGARFIVFDAYDPVDERRREALLALGNGMLVSRAAAPESEADGVHYPGTYRAGCYGRLAGEIAGERVENESLVNLPNWLPLSFRAGGDGPLFSPDSWEILGYRQQLDLEQGILGRVMTVRDREGRRTHVAEERLVSMAERHLVALRLTLTPEDWSGRIEIRSGVDGAVVNGNVRRYAPYDGRHLDGISGTALGDDGVLLRARIRQSGAGVAVAARTRLGAAAERAVRPGAASVTDHRWCDAAAGQAVTIEKVAALHTALDPGGGDPAEAAARTIAAAPGFAAIRAAHIRAWAGLRGRCGIAAGRPALRHAVDLDLFHLLGTVSPHSADLDVGVPPRGWQEAYRGQIFWDEIFVLPVLAWRFPDLARALLLYRYRRLDAARDAARRHGCRGAMFPWRSASTGREETPAFQLNLLSGRWMRDPTQLQRHIGAAVAMNVWRYVETTGDLDFAADHGAEMLIEIARFWASIARPDGDGRFAIRGVIGPDEYHNAYPDADAPGLDNNAYTNLMAVWTLCRALDMLDRLPRPRREALCRRLGLAEGERALWDRISRRMRLVFHGDGILSQFEGFDRLKDCSPAALARRHPGQRADWVLEARGEAADAYQVTKQADVLTLLHLLPEQEVVDLTARLGYRVSRDQLRRTARYYLDRTTHESSLSRVVFAGALARLDPDASWRSFQAALHTDLDPANNHSTEEGIHLSAMAGTLDVLQRRYLGIRADEGGVLVVDPALPAALGAVRMRILFRGNAVAIEVAAGCLRVEADSDNASEVPVLCRGARLRLRPGAVHVDGAAAAAGPRPAGGISPAPGRRPAAPPPCTDPANGSDSRVAARRSPPAARHRR